MGVLIGRSFAPELLLGLNSLTAIVQFRNERKHRFDKNRPAFGKHHG